MSFGLFWTSTHSSVELIVDQSQFRSIPQASGIGMIHDDRYCMLDGQDPSDSQMVLRESFHVSLGPSGVPAQLKVSKRRLTSVSSVALGGLTTAKLGEVSEKDWSSCTGVAIIVLTSSDRS
jgi:hypothetical protein